MLRPEEIRHPKFLPTTKDEVRRLGWEQLDVILFSGDAYIDHPSFGTAVIARVLEHAGYKVGVVPQPNWRDDLRDFKKLGRPRLFFGVNAGAMDSMVNHYTSFKRLRSNSHIGIIVGIGYLGILPDVDASAPHLIRKDNAVHSVDAVAAPCVPGYISHSIAVLKRTIPYQLLEMLLRLAFCAVLIGPVYLYIVYFPAVAQIRHGLQGDPEINVIIPDPVFRRVSP